MMFWRKKMYNMSSRYNHYIIITYYSWLYCKFVMLQYLAHVIIPLSWQSYLVIMKSYHKVMQIINLVVMNTFLQKNFKVQ
jgi:hypothetical protein